MTSWIAFGFEEANPASIGVLLGQEIQQFGQFTLGQRANWLRGVSAPIQRDVVPAFKTWSRDSVSGNPLNVLDSMFDQNVGNTLQIVVIVVLTGITESHPDNHDSSVCFSEVVVKNIKLDDPCHDSNYRAKNRGHRLFVSRIHLRIVDWDLFAALAIFEID